MSAKLGGKAFDIFSDTGEPDAPKRAKKTPPAKPDTTPMKKAAPKRDTKAPTDAPPEEGKRGRPVTLTDWTRVSIVFEKRHIRAMDTAIFNKKMNDGKRYSYSDVVRWLVDQHLKDF